MVHFYKNWYFLKKYWYNINIWYIQYLMKTYLQMWPSAEEEALYFLIAHLLLCYIIPLLLISLCYIMIWIKVINFYIINTLKPFWSILGQRKASLVIFFMKKENEFSCFFLATILDLMAYIRPLEIILAKKKTELIFLFHKNITKLAFLWANMNQKCFKALTCAVLYKIV